VIEIDDEDVDLKKAVRFLDDFQFFDPKNHYDLVDLSVLENTNNGHDRFYEGLGKVSAMIDEEDAGQEDDLEASTVLLRLSSILKYTIDYTKRNEYVFIRIQISSLLSSTVLCMLRHDMPDTSS
jgi:hypothetical protein